MPASLALHDCRLDHPLRLYSEAARCGLFPVPEDRATPHGAMIELHVAVVPALNRRSEAAPLFLLAGGPGQSAIDLYVSFAGAFARVNRDHDIVMVDQRGTGRSSPIDCRYPDDWKEGADALPELKRATLECLAKFGDRVRFYTSTAAVQDLDEVRKALGYGAIDLYGASYGTRVAELYMRRHPHDVHAVILDGVSDPEHAIGPATPLDGERALLQIIARCADNRECAEIYPDLQRDLAGLRRRFGPESVSLQLDDPGSGLPTRVDFNRGMMDAALRFLSYSATEAALLPALIHQAALGNLAPLAAQTIIMSRQIGDQLASGMQYSVICSEDVPFFAAENIDRERLAATYQGTDQLDALVEICKLWPRGPVDPELHAPLHSDIPTLLLSGEDDPVTPPAQAERVARGLPRHRHLLLAGEGHGQLATGCMPRLLAQFLDGREPERLDTACLAQHRPPPFFLSLTGPSP
jgi:pimeloyl-ACP methyl ester carboxylesterase